MENSVFYTDDVVSDESVSGNSQWYVVLEQPLPITQQAAGSPIPPPRQRHNPFNKPEANPHQRSHSLRSAPGNKNITNNSLIYLFVFEGLLITTKHFFPNPCTFPYHFFATTLFIIIF